MYQLYFLLIFLQTQRPWRNGASNGGAWPQLKVRRCVRRARLSELWRKIDSKFHHGIGLVAVQPLPEDLGNTEQAQGDHPLFRP